MAKKYIKRAASLHFYDRSEEKKESKNEIFFFWPENIMSGGI